MLYDLVIRSITSLLSSQKPLVQQSTFLISVMHVVIAVLCVLPSIEARLLSSCLQNNGVIALTNVSSRQAGYAAAVWLMIWGIIGKFGGLVLTIPQCVLGGGEMLPDGRTVCNGLLVTYVHTKHDCCRQ